MLKKQDKTTTKTKQKTPTTFLRSSEAFSVSFKYQHLFRIFT